MRILLLLFPLCALAYFVWQARSSRVFLLGIPFLMFFRQSVFFDKIKLFWMPARFSAVTLSFLWLVVVWAVCSGVLLPSRRRPGERKLGPFGPALLPEELAVLALAGVVALGLLTTSLETADPATAVGEAWGLIMMLAGYALIRGIVCRSSRGEVLRFIDAVVVVDTIAAALFVVHQGLHIHVYSGAEYFQTVFQGRVITRTFAFMSPLFFLALAVSFAKRRWTVWTYLIVAVNLVAIWVSYTRTMLAMAAVAALVTVAARLLLSGQGAIAVRRAVAIAVVVLSLAVVLVTVLPTESNYFVGRIQHALAGDRITSAGSLEIRNQRLARAYGIVGKDDIVLGRGFQAPAQDAQHETFMQWGWDSAWIPILDRLGLLGITAFLAVLAAFMARAVWLMRQADAWSQDYGLTWFTFLVVTLIGSYLGSGFMDTSRFPMNLWFLAFVAAGALLPGQLPEAVPERAAAAAGPVPARPLITEGGGSDA